VALLQLIKSRIKIHVLTIIRAFVMFSLTSLEKEEQLYQARLSAIANAKAPDPIGLNTLKAAGSTSKKSNTNR